MTNSIPLSPDTVLVVLLLCRLGIFAVFLFLFRKSDWRLNLILFSILFLATLSSAAGYMLAREVAPGVQALAYLIVAVGVLAGPTVLLYLRVYLTGRFFTIRNDISHIILFPIAFGLLFMLAILQNDRYTYQNLDTLSALGLLVYGGLYLWFSLRLIVRIRRKMEGKIRPVFWPVFFLSDYLALTLIRAAVLFIRGGFDPARTEAYAVILFAGGCLTVLEAAGILVLGAVRLYRLRSPGVEKRMSPEEVKRVVKLVRERVELKKAYRDPGLSLKGMARVLNVPHRNLARIMEEKFAANFMDYVNGFRVREAVALLEKFAGQRTILGLSLQSGFDSRAVFSKAFKKLTGFTPREYVRNFKRGV